MIRFRSFVVALAAVSSIAAAASAAEAGDAVRLADGRRIGLVCAGEGGPTVILTAGLGQAADVWRKVQAGLAGEVRACAWDRAGFGASDPSPETQDAAHTTADLEQALAAAHIDGPYVLVGQSLGAYETLLFADRHRKAVAGMVLVDPSWPGMTAAMRRAHPDAPLSFGGWYDKTTADLEACADRPETGAEREGCRTRLSTFRSIEQDSEETVKADRSYGAMPLIVLTAAKPPQGSTASLAAMTAPVPLNHPHQRLAALSTRGEDRPVPQSGHMIHTQAPEVVVDAIREVLAAARATPPN